MCEKPILKKFQLSDKFLKRIMHADKKSLGLDLMRPKTILAMLIVKQHVRNMRLMSNVANLIKANE